MAAVMQALQQRLHSLEQADQRRQLQLPAGLDFASNDTLGLHADGVGAGAGAPASRLLRGHLSAHAALETQVAQWQQAEAALLFSTGYMANVGLLSAVVQPGDRVISDAQNHASTIDGLRLSGCEHKVILPHLDVQVLAQTLATPHPHGNTFVVTESLFSMDGDLAPLSTYADLCDAHGAALIVDEAHAVGVYGADRRSGLAEVYAEQELARRCFARVVTFGKALAVGGACVVGSQLLVDYLVNHARSFIFTTALPPVVVRAVQQALDVVVSGEGAERAARVLVLADRLRGGLKALGLDCLQSVGPVVPVVLGSNGRAVAVAERLQSAGYDVRAVRPPTVAPGTARLRIVVHANHTEAQIDGLVQEVGQSVGRSVDQRMGPSVGQEARGV